MDYEEKLKWTREYRLKRKLNGKQCSKCNKKDVLRKTLCENCYRKDLYHKQKQDIEFLEKKRKHSRSTYRRKKGIDINTPLLQRQDGTGTYQYGYKKMTVKNHPNADSNGRILEHKLIMSNHLNRPLAIHERVHHKNGIRDDNRIENLELWSISQPSGQRIEDKIIWAKEFLEFYGYTITRNHANTK